MFDEQPGPQVLGFGRQCLQPTQRGDALAALHRPFDAFLDQLRRKVMVGGGERVLDRLSDQPVALVPTGGTEVQLAHASGTLAPEPASKEICEEIMVTVPAPLVVQSEEEEVLPLKTLQHRLPIGVAGEIVAQRSGKIVEDRGRKQKFAHVRGLASENLLGQKVEYVTVAAREGFDEAGGVFATPHGETGQLQPGDPALCPLLQRRDILF